MLLNKSTLLKALTSIVYVCAMCCASDLVESEKYFSNEAVATIDPGSPGESAASYVYFCKDIRKRLENPSGDGNSLLKSILSFYENLRSMRDQLEANITNVYCKTFYMALQQTNGPEYVRAKLNSASLLKEYKWSNLDIGEVYELIRDTQSVWGKIRAHAERLGLDKIKF